MSQREQNSNAPGAKNPEATLALEAALDEIEVLLVCGSGGVGKTSVAAAIALGAARRGRKVCVLTIDPAKRLADAMGIRALGDAPRKVRVPGGCERGGSLSALMLDAQDTFDRVVGETSRDEAQRRRILDNKIYQQISQHAVGMQEYMAIERLYELDRSQKFDLIVVDTPPAAHARDLLEAPQTLLRFFEGRSLRWFLRPSMHVGRLGLRALGGPSNLLISLLSKVTGVDAIRDAADFFDAFDGMYETLASRIKVVERMLADERTAFTLVTSPERESILEAGHFWDLLEDRDLRYLGSIVNRVEPAAGAALPSVRAFTDFGLRGELTTTVRQIVRDHQVLARRDRERIADLTTLTDDAPLLAVPRLPHMVSDLTSLTKLEPHLFVSR